jgi:adenylate cyclase
MINDKKQVISDWMHFILPILVILAVVAVRVVDLDFIKGARFAVFDTYQRLQPRQYQNLPVRVIDIDNDTLAKLGQWPWSRTKVAELVTQLKAMGASAIGFDAVFAEMDRTSPQNIAQLWQQNLGIPSQLQEQISRLPNHDLLFADAMKKAGNVVLSFSLSDDPGEVKPLLNFEVRSASKSYLDTLPFSPSSIKNIDILEQAAAGNGSYDISAETDNIVRRLPLLFHLGNNAYPSLVLELLRIQEHSKFIRVLTVKDTEPAEIAAVQVGRYTIPTDYLSNLWISFTPHSHKRVIPVWKILEKKQQFDLKNCIVIIGTSATGLKDQRATPLNPFASSVEIHVNALEQILLGKFLYIPSWAMPLDIALVVGWGLFFIIGMRYLGPVTCLFWSVLFISLSVIASWTAFQRYGWLIDPSYSSVGTLLIYFVVAIINFVKTELERNNVRNAFNRYLSPSLTEQLVKNPTKLELGGEMRDMTILFCDIRGFTTISEQFDAHGLTQFVNRFLTPMTIVILENQGTIDKYIGDCIMAFWNAPLEDKDHAVHAANSALLMLEQLVKLNHDQQLLAEKEQREFIPINVGIGLNSGVCCVGNMGSEMRFDYSVLGDDVNLAARLESQSKTYEVSIVLGEATQQQISHFFALLELDLIQVKGKLKAVRIFTLLGDKSVKDSENFHRLAKLHQEMLVCYRARQWQKALHLLEQCRQMKEFPLQNFYNFYERRVLLFINNPPPDNWNGVYVATDK